VGGGGLEAAVLRFLVVTAGAVISSTSSSSSSLTVRFLVVLGLESIIIKSSSSPREVAAPRCRPLLWDSASMSRAEIACPVGEANKSSSSS
jgi:hypothetical protein